MYPSIWVFLFSCKNSPRWPSGNVPASRVADPGLVYRLRRDFSGSGHTSDLRIGTPVAALPEAWR